MVDDSSERALGVGYCSRSSPLSSLCFLHLRQQSTRGRLDMENLSRDRADAAHLGSLLLYVLFGAVDLVAYPGAHSELSHFSTLNKLGTLWIPEAHDASQSRNWTAEQLVKNFKAILHQASFSIKSSPRKIHFDALTAE